jgi:hypothetical protein
MQRANGLKRFGEEASNATLKLLFVSSGFLQRSEYGEASRLGRFGESLGLILIMTIAVDGLNNLDYDHLTRSELLPQMPDQNCPALSQPVELGFETPNEEAVARSGRVLNSSSWLNLLTSAINAVWM